MHFLAKTDIFITLTSYLALLIYKIDILIISVWYICHYECLMAFNKDIINSRYCYFSVISYVSFQNSIPSYTAEDQGAKSCI